MNKRITRIKQLLLTLFLLTTIGGYAQEYSLQFNDEKVNLNEIKTITFSENDFSVNLLNGTSATTAFTTLYFFGKTTEIEEIFEQKAAFKIYPNPVHDYLQIVSEKPVGNVYIYDIHGKLIKYLETTENELSVDLSFLPNGFYLVKTSSQITKIIKQ